MGLWIYTITAAVGELFYKMKVEISSLVPMVRTSVITHPDKVIIAHNHMGARFVYVTLNCYTE